MASRVDILVLSTTMAGEQVRWAVDGFLPVWREHGIDARYVLGPKQATGDADVLFLHVDLSVVPPSYLAAASRYPRAINARVADIRKTTISRQRAMPGDGYSGPVIVKSNLNCAAAGELLLVRQRVLPVTGVPKFPFRLLTQEHYKVFERAELVPAAYFHDANLIVERFLPERDGDLYVCRSHHLLGSRSTTVRMTSDKPIVLGHTAKTIDSVEPHPDVVRAAQQLGLEYGKIDYLERDGQAIIIDVNKTTGEGAVSADPRVIALRRHRSMGILDFLKT